jgi:carboxyl-terminal processing protease
LKNFIRFGGKAPANDPGALKLTIKKFYRASGVSTQLKGVVPDVVLPSILNESKEIGESSLDNPLACDKIDSAKYDHLNLVDPYVQTLKKRSDERIATDKDFAYIREDIEYYKKQQADKTVSLNEQQRLKEKEELDARAKARNKERLARAESNEKVYELSLKQAQLPGLPAPMAHTNLTARLSTGKAPVVASAIGTNSPIAAAQEPLRPTTQDSDTEEEKPSPVDATLNETEHILMDYISMWTKPNVVTAIH